MRCAGHRRAIVLIVLFVASLWLVSGLANLTEVANAQGAFPPIWDEPINLSDTPTQSWFPAIVADPSGMVHVFWGENLLESTNYSNAIFYTRWDGESWSAPHDILLSPQGLSAMAGSPAVAVGGDARLHLVWSGGFGGRIYYSAARADEAIDAHAWSRPLELNESAENGSDPRIAVDSQGVLHVVYEAPSGAGQGIYYMRSEDDGGTWTAPARIPGTSIKPDTLLGDVRLAIGGDGTLHVTWMWATLPDSFPPKGVYYTRSTDSGNTWSEPIVMADGPFRFPAIAVVGDREVHLVWSGTTSQRYKFHRWSRDGGETWSAPDLIPSLGGFQGYAGMAVDSSGALHLALVGSHPVIGDALFHSQWSGREWVDPEKLFQNTIGPNAANADMAISGGNQIIVVVEAPAPTGEGGKYHSQIFLVRGQAGVPAVAPLAPPSPTPTAVVAPTSLPTSHPAPGGVAASDTPSAEPPPTPTETDPLAVGVISAAGFLLAVILVGTRRRHAV